MNIDLSNSSRLSSNSHQENSKIIIDEIYALKQLVLQHPFYNMYEGIDIPGSKFIHIYLAPVNNTSYCRATPPLSFPKKSKNPSETNSVQLFYGQVRKKLLMFYITRKFIKNTDLP
jgi:hypothetical protein